MSYGNSIFIVSASIFRYQCFDMGLGAILVEIIMQNLANSVTLFSIQGFQLFNNSIDIVLAFEFGHEITILRTAIFDIAD